MNKEIIENYVNERKLNQRKQSILNLDKIVFYCHNKLIERALFKPVYHL